MGFFSLFKPPVSDTLRVICSAYHSKLQYTGDSRLGFIAMAEEALNQLHKQTKKRLGDSSATYRFLPIKVDELNSDHDINREHLEQYLYAIMILIRDDYYNRNSSDYHARSARLELLIKSALK